jgi:glutathione-regulated potassium-efflux system ancillary protein KefG
MSKVLLVVGHPDLSQSKANAALVDAVRDLTHVTVHDLYATYPDFQIDVDAEQALLAEHDVIVFQHPVFWYNTTPLFKQWQDKVFTLGWAFTMDGSASQLAGKKAVVAVSASSGRRNDRATARFATPSSLPRRPSRSCATSAPARPEGS